ncbi:tRNA-specific adenosine deaminase [bioreactor metagenome]|uniref:tRNA-specific adenosine deaminase 2 n=1 Tax=bioreactor metagenome TaxID=1076179 RepID=A0A645CDQ5_9ZZZZ|nr:tRNA adenosine(34) deaminase TadA [Erysipelotrichaceae bacterium]
MTENDHQYMKIALKEAQKALAKGEVPVGAIIVLNGKIIARAHNLKAVSRQATHHAEILAIQKASRKIGDWRLDDSEMYVTLEPCPMCAGALIQSRIRRVIFGAYDPKGGSVVSCQRMFDVPGYNHYPEVTAGVLEKDCSLILSDFFKKMRKSKKSPINLI